MIKGHLLFELLSSGGAAPLCFWAGRAAQHTHGGRERERERGREREREGERARDAAKQQSRNDDSRSPTETNKQTQPYMLDRQERAFLYALRARDDVAEAGHSGDHPTLNERIKDNQAGYPAGTKVDIGRQIYHQHSLFIYVYIYIIIYINMLLPIFEIEVADLPTSSGEAVRCASDSRHEQL